MHTNKQQFFYALAGSILGSVGGLLLADRDRRKNIREMARDIKTSSQGHWQNIKGNLREGAHDVAAAARSASSAALDTGQEIKYEGKELAYEIRDKAKRRFGKISKY